MHLREQLANWDGKSTLYLTNLYDVVKSEPVSINQLFGLLADVKVQAAATWLIKYALEDGSLIKQSLIYKLYDSVDELVTWQAKLHLLQMIPLVVVPEKLKYWLSRFCHSATEDENKFVRAWGYNGQFVS